MELYGWLFTYNPYTKKWYSGKVEDIVKLNNGDDSSVISDEKLSRLIKTVKSLTK
jgi:hypothetical protein